MNTLRNRVQLVGHLGTDVSLKTIPSGAKVANLRMATTDRYLTNGTWKDDTQWHNLVLWEKLAERAEQYLAKGSYVMVEGRLEHRSYEVDGQTKYITEIKVSNFISLDKRTSDDKNADSGNDQSEPELNDGEVPF